MAGTQRALIYGFCCLQRAESGGVVNAAITLFFQGHFGLTGPVAATAIDNHLALLVFTYDTATLIDHTDPPGSDGTIILTFTSCNSATVECDIPSINRQGIVPIQRVAGDNIALCEVLSIE
jgi:hypothetical protein